MVSPSRGAARSTLTITAHLLGADKTNDLKPFYNYSIKIGILLSAISCVILILFNSTIISELTSIESFINIWYLVALAVKWWVPFK